MLNKVTYTIINGKIRDLTRDLIESSIAVIISYASFRFSVRYFSSEFNRRNKTAATRIV